MEMDNVLTLISEDDSLTLYRNGQMRIWHGPYNIKQEALTAIHEKGYVIEKYENVMEE
jgi:hypothetical protein